jgi:transcriptional regulator with XRE-family HTH domain
MAKRRKRIGPIWVQARLSLGLKQFELAKKLKITPAYLSLIENDKRPSPSLDLIRRMSQLSELTIDQLSGA